jgi:hypothetical protein
MNIRHGDLALIQLDKLPEGLKKSNSKVLMTGSGGNNHTYDNGVFYPKKENEFVIGYFVAVDNTKLYHIEHGNIKQNKTLQKTKIPKGIYQLKKQCEETNDGMKPVVD